MAVYDRFASEYSVSVGDEGDYFHRTQIDPSIFAMLGDIKGKKIYDLGCGNGYMSRKMAKMGAEVWASDESKKLIAIAKAHENTKGIRYAVHDGLNFDGYEVGSFDFVVMNMVIHYIKDLDALMSGVSKLLKKNGMLIFSKPHLFRPMYPYAEWVKGEIGGKERLFIKVTGYLKEEARKTESLWGGSSTLTLYHRPLQRFVETLAKNGMYIAKLHEPESQGFAKEFSEKLQKSHHIPTFLIVGAQKF